MKKVVLFSLILALVLIPTIAMADMGAPGFVAYSGYISNPYGANYYRVDSDDAQVAGTVPFQTKIICHYNYSSNRFAFVDEGETFSYEDDAVKYVDKYNVTIDDLSKYNLGKMEEVRTFDNTIIYNLPTDATEGKVLGMIPSETDIKVQAYENDEKATGLWNDWTEWYYTSYNGVNGWVKLNNFAFLYENKERETVTSKNLLSKDGAFIPMFTPVKEYYGFGGGQFSRAMFYYEGELVEYDQEQDVAIKAVPDEYEDYEYEILVDGISLYEQANVKSKKVVDSIPVGTKLVGEYVVCGHAFYTWMCVRYEGSLVWLYIGDLYAYKNKADAEEQFEYNRKTLEEAREKNWEWYTELNYPTSYDGLKKYYESHIADGITYSKAAIEESDASKRIGTAEVKTEKTEIAESGNPLVEGPEIEAVYSNFATSTVVLIALIVSVAIILLLTVVVIILLVNRKKK